MAHGSETTRQHFMAVLKTGQSTKNVTGFRLIIHFPHLVSHVILGISRVTVWKHIKKFNIDLKSEIKNHI